MWDNKTEEYRKELSRLLGAAVLDVQGEAGTQTVWPWARIVSEVARITKQ